MGRLSELERDVQLAGLLWHDRRNLGASKVVDNCTAPDRVCVLSRRNHIGEPINYQHTPIKVSQEPEFTYLRKTLCWRETRLIVWLILSQQGRLRIANSCPECVLRVCLATHYTHWGRKKTTYLCSRRIPSKNILRLLFVLHLIPLPVIISRHEKAIEFHRKPRRRRPICASPLAQILLRRRPIERTDGSGSRWRWGHLRICRHRWASITRPARWDWDRHGRLPWDWRSCWRRGVFAICLAAGHDCEFCVDAFKSVLQLQRLAGSGVPCCYAGVCRFGVRNYGFEVFQVDRDVHILFDQVLLEVARVCCYGCVDWVF